MHNNSQRDNDRLKVNAAPETPEPAAVEIPTEDPAPVVEEKSPIFSGVVADCLRLNVRKVPDPEAEILTVIEVLSEVVVDMNASTDKFYKVCTAAGIEGFCMKKYIALRN